MRSLVIIKHGHCETCNEDKTISVYRKDGELQPEICGACELRKEV